MRATKEREREHALKEERSLKEEELKGREKCESGSLFKKFQAVKDFHSPFSTSVFTMDLSRACWIIHPSVQVTMDIEPTDYPPKKRSRKSPVLWNPNKPSTHVSSLYPELLSMIFEYLDVQGKGRVAQVCTSWKEAAYLKSVWRGVRAKLHLKRTKDNADVFKSLVRRGITKIQVRMK